MKPNIKITDDNLAKTALLLNGLLADEMILYTKTRSAHWNVAGPYFMELHHLFQAHYEELSEIVDNTAERVKMLGHIALGSMKAYLAATCLTEAENPATNATEIMEALLADHETVIGAIRKQLPAVTDEYNDAGTADFITGLMQQHEKMAWMLRASVAN
jgi:starvation-inducible DNA-binding protein